jgi:hypothetical protein
MTAAVLRCSSAAWMLAFMAVSVASAKAQASISHTASPMTYMVGGVQYVAIAAGSNVLSFALPQN